MKKVVAALLIGVFTAVPAQVATAQTDPVSTLKSRIAVGKGVTFTDVTSYVELSGKTKALVRRGALQYGKAAIAAADVSIKVIKQDSIPALFTDERIITIGKISYMKGGPFVGDLPKGKSWVKTRKPLPAGFVGAFSQPVNVAEPATLKALITGGERSGRTYTGEITFRQLSKISPWTRSSSMGAQDDERIRYTLTLGSDNLPRRLVTTYTADGHWPARTSPGDEVVNETVYKGWGSRRTITPPPAGQVYVAKR